MKKLACIALAVSAACGTAWADDAAVQQLVQQAQYWQKKNRPDLAADVWRKLLRAQPSHPQALVQLGLIEARSGRFDEARALYDRASQLPSPPRGLIELSNALKAENAGAADATPRAGSNQEASRQAAKNFRDAPAASQPERMQERPRPVVQADKPARPETRGLEYYQSLGATREGWNEARAGLEQLARSHPGDARYLLALAHHLSYREASRREGIRQLANLVQRGQGGVEAQKAWRQALVLLNAQERDRPLFDAYLARFPADQAIAQRLAALDHVPAPVRELPIASASGGQQTGGRQSSGRQNGFQLMEQGQLDEAEARFREALRKNPRDPNALGGLGIVRLRQEMFADALGLLNQAMANDKRGKRGSERWQQARASAQYWLLMRQATSARDAGQSVDALDKVQQAVRLNPGEPAGQVLYADLLTQQRDYARAEQIYRQVLSASPQHAGAVAGLASLLGETGRNAEAAQLLTAQGGSGNPGMDKAKAANLIKLAESDERAGNYALAAQRLEDAILLDPTNPWARLALARQYEKSGDLASAGALLDNLIDANPQFAQALFARALLYGAQQRAWEGLLMLEQIPPQARTRDMAIEQRRLWIAVQSLRAKQLAEQGQPAQSQALMAQAESVAGDNPAWMGAAASGWMELGQSARALRLLRDAVARSPVQEIGIRIQYAGALLSQRQDAELRAVLQDLAARPLNAQQQKELNQVIAAFTVQQTDALREAGQYAQAYDTINPALQQSSDPRLVMALARLYNSAGEPASGLQLAENVIEREPDELDHRLFASGVALGAKAYAKALGHAEAALDLAPEHPRALSAAGRAEKALGHIARAKEYFQAALERERDQGAFAGASGQLSLRLVDELPRGANPAQAGQGAAPALLPIPGARGQATQPGGTMPIPGGRSPVAPLPARSSSAPGYSGAAAYRSDGASGSSGNFYNAAPVAAAPPATSGYFVPVAAGAYGSAASASSYVAPAPAIASRSQASVLPPLAAAGRTTQAAAAQPAANQPKREPSAAEELRALQSSQAATLDVAASVRNRSGDTGTSRLSEAETAIEAKVPLGDANANLTLRMAPVILKSGDVNLADARNASKFGSAALTPPGNAAYVPSHQQAHGVAVSAGFDNGTVAADIGATPLGFEVRNVVGGLALSHQLGEVTLKAALSRRAVTDSLLSYAGTRDPLTGRSWGGVVRNALRLSAGYDNGAYGLYAGGSYASLTGENVKTNRQYEASLGAYLRAYETADSRFTLGLNLTALGYRDNLSFFTLGQGGYFSPQNYVSFSMPFDWAARQGKLSYQFGGDVGVRHFRQDRTPYFAGNTALQTAWKERLALTPASNTFSAYYNGESVSGVGYNLYGAFEYRMAPQVAFGGRLKFDNSRNYAQQTGLLYLRYAFDAMPEPVGFPPRSFKPLYLGDSM